MKFFNNLKIFAKNNTFNFILLMLILVGMAFDGLQSAAIVGFNVSLDNHKKDTAEQIKKYNSVTTKNAEENYKRFERKLGVFNTTLSARVDTLDSAIDPELKRRKLVKNIRSAIVANTRRKLTMKELNRIANAVIEYSYEQNITIAMVLAQIKQESDFNPGAESHAQAKGLMQILDHPQRSTANDVAAELGYRGYNIWDIRVNIRFGCYYMRKMLTAYNNNYDDALRAYNFGPHKVDALKSGDIDYSNSKIVIENGIEVKYLVDKYGEFELDNEGSRIKIKEEHKYPAETRDYVKKVRANREIFAKYGLDKIE